MRTLSILGHVILAVSTAIVLPGSALADSTTIDFEGLSDNTVIGSTYSGLGVSFTNAVIITAGVSLNELEFPPHSGVNVAYDAGGPITVDFKAPISEFSAYYTYTTPLVVQGYDPANRLLQTADSLFSRNFVSSGNPPNELISLSGADFWSVVITGAPGGRSFVMDDLTFRSITVTPEPSSFSDLLTVLPLLLLIRRLSYSYRAVWKRSH